MKTKFGPLTTEQKQAIRLLLAGGLTPTQIARLLGVSRPTIYSIKDEIQRQRGIINGL